MKNLLIMKMNTCRNTVRFSTTTRCRRRRTDAHLSILAPEPDGQKASLGFFIRFLKTGLYTHISRSRDLRL